MILKILIAALVVVAAAFLLASARSHTVKAPTLPAQAPGASAEARFWAVVEATAQGDPDQSAQSAALRSALGKMTVAQVEEFDRVFQQKMRESYRWDLWGAAYVIRGGASDDGFEYFRRWLISRGRAFYEQALADPDGLAEIVPADAVELEYEEFSQIAMEVWAEKTGRNPSEMPMETGQASSGPLGEPMQEDEAWLAEHYPKLWKRFGSTPLG